MSGRRAGLRKSTRRAMDSSTENMNYESTVESETEVCGTELVASEQVLDAASDVEPSELRPDAVAKVQAKAAKHTVIEGEINDVRARDAQPGSIRNPCIDGGSESEVENRTVPKPPMFSTLTLNPVLEQRWIHAPITDDEAPPPHGNSRIRYLTAKADNTCY